MRKPTHRITIEVIDGIHFWEPLEGDGCLYKNHDILNGAFIEELPREIELGDWVTVKGYSGKFRVASVADYQICIRNGNNLIVFGRRDCTLITAPENHEATPT